MTRNTTILLTAIITIACAGCGESGTPQVAARQSAPPKPAPPPSGDPSEAPVKPGSEVPAQFGGRQFTQLIGRPSPAATNPGPDASATGGDSSAPTATQPATGTPASGGPTFATPAAPATGRDASAPTTGAKPPAAAATDVTVETARPGVGAQGKGYGTPDAGLITTPIAGYFGAREQIVFNQILEAMNFFKTLNGRYPKSQEEFNKEILEPAAIKLPELPEGAKYVYDPEKGELTVVRPKPK